jgi:hypothetical protein
MNCFVFDFILHNVFVLHQCVVARIRPSQSLLDMTCMPEIKATPASVHGVKSTFMFIWISLLRIDLKPVRNSSARFGRIVARKDSPLNVRCTLRMRFCASFISSFNTLFSILGYIMLSFGKIWVSLGVVKHPASYPVGTRDLFPGGKAAGAWCWPLTSIKCRGQLCVELYLHSLIHLHGVVLS